MEKEPEITESCGNVFADLGLPNAEELLQKSRLILMIQRAMEGRSLNQVKAAKIMGIKQPDLSKLLAGRFHSISIEKLMSMLNALGMDVELVVRPARGQQGEFRVLQVV